MSKYMDNLSIATKYQLDALIDILIKKNIITKDEINNMVKEKLDNTLLYENEKLEIMSLINR